MKFTMKKSGGVDPSKDLDLGAAKLALQRVAQNRAAAFARAMTDGLHDAADYVMQTRLASGDVSESFSSAHKDAGHVQFAAQDEPPIQVGDRALSESVVDVVVEPTPSGRSSELVAKAFEFGSAAMDTPATAFSLAVEEKQRQAARNDMEEVAEVIE